MTRSPQGTFVLLSLSLAVLLPGLLGCQNQPASQAAPAQADVPADDLVERGAYLVTVLGCNDCHTPWIMGAEGPEPDMSRMLSGHPEDLKVTPPPELEAPWMWAGAATNTAFAGPWGITYGANLTPDPETGLARWTEDQFVQALQTGKQMGVGRPIMPPMPWQGYAQMTEEDLRAMYAFLQTIPPIENRVPPYQPPAEPAE